MVRPMRSPSRVTRRRSRSITRSLRRSVRPVCGVGQLAIRPAQERLDAAHQLADAERLDEVVIGAHLEPDDLVDLVRAGGQEQHRRARLAPQLAQHLEAVDPRQPHVEHHEVGSGIGEVGEGVLARGLDADRVALALECHLHAAGDGGLVLDDHDGAGHGRRL